MKKFFNIIIFSACISLFLIECVNIEFSEDFIDTNPVYIYNSTLGDRTGNLGKWYSYIQNDNNCPTKFGGFSINSLSPASCFTWLSDNKIKNLNYITSKGPWWIDPNHKTGTPLNGYGFVNVVAFSQIPSRTNIKIDLSDSTLEFTARVSDDFKTITANSREGLKKSHIYLWFESAPRKIENCIEDPTIGENCTRQSDYILTDIPIDKYLTSNNEFNFSIDLNSFDESKWTCLGAGDNVKYDCMGLAEALKNAYTIGFLAAPVKSCKLGSENKCDLDVNPSDYYNVGSFEFKNFKIKKKYSLPSKGNVVNFNPSNNTASPSSGWSPIKFSNSKKYNNYSGIKFTVNKNISYFRTGLSSSNLNNKFEDIGFHLYLSSEGKIFVVINDGDNNFNKIISISNYNIGDEISLYSENNNMYITKNFEIIYTIKQNSNSSELFTFVSKLGNDSVFPEIYSF